MTRSPTPRIAIVGAGPAGLMAAQAAALGGAAVTIFDRMPSPGRKLLLAGRGGLNLTHSEPPEHFSTRYGAAGDRLAPILSAFDAVALRSWCADLGVETFIGSSGRVFPTSLKTSPLLRAWLARLAALDMRFAFRHLWRGWDRSGRLLFETPDGRAETTADATVLALGGASWPHLGSDGGWTHPLGDAGVRIAPLRPANCGFIVAWSDLFRERFEGAPLKAVALTFDGSRTRGDAIVTKAGLEGGAVYALAAPLRDAIARTGANVVRIALRPDLAHETLVAKLAKRSRKDSVSNGLRKALGLAPVAIGLLRETSLPESRPLGTLDAEALAQLVNAVPVRLEAPMPLARAISTAGGIAFEALDDQLMLSRRPGVFVAGEMLDWEAPTGGYLLQACFATGHRAGTAALAWAEGERGANQRDRKRDDPVPASPGAGEAIRREAP